MAHGCVERARALGLTYGSTSDYLRGLTQVICVFMPPFSHLSNDDIIPTPHWVVERLNRTSESPPPPSTMLGRGLFFPHYVSSLLGTNQWLALTGMCTLAPALWMTANPTQEPEAQENTGHQVQGSFHPILCQT